MGGNGIVQKLWNYCNVLRDDGLSYQDYLEQLATLLFLKMAHEQSQLLGKPSIIPPDVHGKPLDWPSLLALDGTDLEIHYRHVLTELGKKPGMLGMIFRKAQNKVQDPAKLRRLIADLIDKEEWMTLDADVKGDAYEGLLQKNAEDVKGGAGQYFTPRPQGREHRQLPVQRHPLLFEHAESVVAYVRNEPEGIFDGSYGPFPIVLKLYM